MRGVGLHIRLNDMLLPGVVEKALRLKLHCVQFFLINKRGKLFSFTEQEIRFFQRQRDNFDQLYMHASYWNNFASTYIGKHPLLWREIMLAEKLGFLNIVMHAGSARLVKDKIIGIDNVVRTLNLLAKDFPHLTFIIENVAHGGFTIGGDITDFKIILEKTEYPEKINFCLDTSHAFAYGYALDTVPGRHDFLEQVRTSVSFEKILLIHLNDTGEKAGSHIDRHAVLGQGIIGIEALKSVVNVPELSLIPLLLELPEIAEEEEARVLSDVKSWYYST